LEIGEDNASFIFVLDSSVDVVCNRNKLDDFTCDIRKEADPWILVVRLIEIEDPSKFFGALQLIINTFRNHFFNTKMMEKARSVTRHRRIKDNRAAILTGQGAVNMLRVYRGHKLELVKA